MKYIINESQINKIIFNICALGSSRDVIEDISGIWEKVCKATSIFQLDASLELPEVTLRVGVGHGTRRGARRTWLSAEMLPIPLLGQISHGVHLRGRSGGEILQVQAINGLCNQQRPYDTHLVVFVCFLKIIIMKHYYFSGYCQYATVGYKYQQQLFFAICTSD